MYSEPASIACSMPVTVSLEYNTWNFEWSDLLSHDSVAVEAAIEVTAVGAIVLSRNTCSSRGVDAWNTSATIITSSSEAMANTFTERRLPSQS